MHAYDSSTGKLLWEAKLPFAGLATPATDMVDGQQYVVIAASGGQSSKESPGGCTLHLRHHNRGAVGSGRLDAEL
jgi:glucose dehydrogenase